MRAAAGNGDGPWDVGRGELLAQRVRLARAGETQPKNGERLANCGWCWQRFANKLRHK